MAKATSGVSYISKPKKRGVAAKTQTSKNKTSKLYKKQYRGQGR
jgi:hypothetical protein